MQSIASTVRNTYLSRFNEMDLEYRFHFASRLFAWSSDPDATKLIEKLKAEMMPATHQDRYQNLLLIVDELANKNYERDVIDYEHRKPIFEKYPDLLLLHASLFRIRHWLCVYETDERDLLYKLMSKENIESLLDQLRNDTEAVRILSTYAINTLYLYSKLYSNDSHGLNFNTIHSIAKSYDHRSIRDTQLFIYLYTHCILGETLFYFQPISQNKDQYLVMMQELEARIGENYDNISLDNKFEFLVCARICGFESEHEEKIYNEAAQSLNSEGFIVDVLNHNINPVKQSFMMSEHRNVLYIMSSIRQAFFDNIS